MTKRITLFLFGILCLNSCINDKLDDPIEDQLFDAVRNASPTDDSDYFILPDPSDLSTIPQDPKNPLNLAKVELGKMLFYETGLALAPTYEFCEEFWSCSSCHVPSMGFTPGRVQGIADGGVGFGESGEYRDQIPLYEEHEMDVQGARPLNLMNVAFTTNTSWSGTFGGNNANEGTEQYWTGAAEVNNLGYHGLESQNIEGLHLHRMVINKTVADTLGYLAMYDECFSDFPEADRYTEETTSLAISAYLRSIVTTEAPFQKWLKGESYAMDRDEKEGALLFFGKAGCINCHNSPALNNPNDFYAIGVKDLWETGEAYNTDEADIRNFGRGGFTGQDDDMFKYKVPQLYNMGNLPFYFHGSSKTSMRAVVEYFNEGVKENDNVPATQIAAQFQPLNLTEDEIDKLTLFLEKSLLDKEYERFVPESVQSGYCFPNNDPISQIQLDCE